MPPVAPFASLWLPLAPFGSLCSFWLPLLPLLPLAPCWLILLPVAPFGSVWDLQNIYLALHFCTTSPAGLGCFVNSISQVLEVI